MQIEYSDTAQKQLRKLPKPERIKVLKKIQLLKEDPYAGKKLMGVFEGLRSLKAWPYRIIYRYSPTDKLLFINAIEHRQQVYRF